ncbi:hypothetical protein FACS1894123_00030 [Bacteroidia bacterium]|nr:hypothetical protein FACS1894123_00030 [Bacteroidia bacterium]
MNGERSINKARKQFYRSFVNKGDLCFDVGANRGNRTRPLLNIGARVVAIEPQQSCQKILIRKFGKKIELVPKGCGESNAVKDFYIADVDVLSSFSDKWMNSVKSSHRFGDNKWDKVVQVEITTLDTLIEKYGIPQFIKIDVEGYELNVLKGLTKPIDMISFEYAIPEGIDAAIACIEEIAKNNPNIECNYSVGEGMIFALDKWESVDNMKNRILAESIDCFGDIYVRTKSK